MVSRMELIIYAAIIVVVAAVAVFAADNYLLPQSYSATVKLQSLAPQTIYPYQYANLRIIVNNTGQRTMNGFSLVVYLNNGQLHAFTVDNLGPGQSVPLNISYIPPAGGTYSFKAVLDPAQLFPITDRSSVRSTAVVNVTKAESPNVYTSVPNSNINSTDVFSLNQTGLRAALSVSLGYNQSIFNKMVDSSNRAVEELLTGISSDIVGVNGAYTTYANSSSSYVLWANGPFNASLMYGYLSGLAVGPRNISVSGKNVAFARIGNDTSMCAFYESGWSKIIAYDNASASPQTCASLISNTYNATQPANLAAALKANAGLSDLQMRFLYQNSTNDGSVLMISNGSLAAMTLSHDKYGLFAGYATRNQPGFSLGSANSVCTEFVFSRNNTNTCSLYVVGTAASRNLTFVFWNTSEINQNYTLHFYSLVNRTYNGSNIGLSSQYGASVLLWSLNLSGSSLIWNPFAADSCALRSSAVSCRVLNFNPGNSALSLGLKNNLSNQIRINSLGCFTTGFSDNVTVNETVLAGQTVNATTFCTGLIPSLSEFINYDLLLNYTSNGQVIHASGSTNVTAIEH